MFKIKKNMNINIILLKSKNKEFITSYYCDLVPMSGERIILDNNSYFIVKYRIFSKEKPEEIKLIGSIFYTNIYLNL